MNGHLSQDELLDQLYALGGKQAHLLECADCSLRLEAMAAAKARLRPEELPVTPEFLAAQRRGVHARVKRSEALPTRLAPALAAAFLLAICVFLLRPHAQTRSVPVPVAAAVQADSVASAVASNDQLFSDLYSMEQTFEPRAAAPIRALFEEDGDGGDQ